MNYVSVRGMEGLDLQVIVSGIFSDPLYNFVIVLSFSTVKSRVLTLATIQHSCLKMMVFSEKTRSIYFPGIFKILYLSSDPSLPFQSWIRISVPS